MFKSSFFIDEIESMNLENVRTFNKVEKYDKIWENRGKSDILKNLKFGYDVSEILDYWKSFKNIKNGKIFFLRKNTYDAYRQNFIYIPQKMKTGLPIQIGPTDSPLLRVKLDRRRRLNLCEITGPTLWHIRNS